jgi:hypothetical protein
VNPDPERDLQHLQIPLLFQALVDLGVPPLLAKAIDIVYQSRSSLIIRPKIALAKKGTDHSIAVPNIVELCQQEPEAYRELGVSLIAQLGSQEDNPEWNTVRSSLDSFALHKNPREMDELIGVALHQYETFAAKVRAMETLELQTTLPSTWSMDWVS